MYVRTWFSEETNLLIKCDEERGIDAAIEASLRARCKIEQFIRLHPEFRWSLEPLKFKESRPMIIDLMLRAGELTEVGPFAAVAGAISQVTAEAALNAGAKNVVVENGGDIAIVGNQDFRIGVFAGDAKGSGKIGFRIRAEELPIGICTSSGTIGHSISFGEADAVTVIAHEASVADAAATSIANAVKGEDAESSIEFGLNRAEHIPEIFGCLIVQGDKIGTWGKLPELILLSPKSQELSVTSKRYKNYGPELTPVL